MAVSVLAAVSKALAQVLGGDPLALSVITPIALADLHEAATALGSPLILTRASTVSVLKGLEEAAYSAEQVQGWASFVRRGYVSGTAGGPIRPLHVSYEEAWEEIIAAVVARLDEIGDIVDGGVTKGEVLVLLRLLGQS